MNNQIYIGDNLSVMKSKFFKQYYNKIKFIYIDPPYNTMTDKSYKDKTRSEDWKEFMRQRLEVAKLLMSMNGVIFISIDDNEYANLKILCDEIFDKRNFVGSFITKQSQRSNAKHINIVHEYILCFAKNKTKLEPFSIKRIDIPEDAAIINMLQVEALRNFREFGKEYAEQKLRQSIKKICFDNNITWLKNYSNIDEKGEIFFSVDLSTPGKPREVNIPQINLHLAPLKTRGWATDERLIELYQQNRLSWKNGRPYCKLYLKESTNNCPSCLNFFSRQGTKELKKLGLDDLFDTPKPVELIKFLIRLSTKKDDVILDFFAGSGTTAQAVYELNKEENRNNHYILVQLNENIRENSASSKKCAEIGIKPNMQDIMLYRINTYLERNHAIPDYDLVVDGY